MHNNVPVSLNNIRSKISPIFSGSSQFFRLCFVYCYVMLCYVMLSFVLSTVMLCYVLLCLCYVMLGGGEREDCQVAVHPAL
jgi:hypothetical protein